MGPARFLFVGLLLATAGCGGSTSTGGGTGGAANAGNGGAANAGTGGAANGGSSGAANGGSSGAANGGSGNQTVCQNPTVATNWPFGGACATCMATNCSSLVNACYGPKWRSAIFDGACGPWLQCECNCAYGDGTCMSNCDSLHTQDCWNDQNDVQTCESQQCHQPCMGMVLDAGP